MAKKTWAHPQSLAAYRRSEAGKRDQYFLRAGLPLVTAPALRRRLAWLSAAFILALNTLAIGIYFGGIFLAQAQPELFIDAPDTALGNGPDSTPATVPAAAADSTVGPDNVPATPNSGQALAEISNYEYFMLLSLASLLAGAIAGLALFAVVKTLQTRLSPWASLCLFWAVAALSTVSLPLCAVLAGTKVQAADFLQGIILVAVSWLTIYLGIYHLAAWSARRVIQELTLLGPMTARFLPVLMLTFLFFFFNAEIWQVVQGLPAGKIAAIWLVLIAMAIALVIVTWREHFGYLLEDRFSPEVTKTYPAKKAGGPKKLRGRERLNFFLLPLVAQLIQILLFTTLITVFFITFGYFFISQLTIESWAKGAGNTWQIMGMKLAINPLLVKVSIVLGGLSGLSFAASNSSDALYREHFLSPIASWMNEAREKRDNYVNQN